LENNLLLEEEKRHQEARPIKSVKERIEAGKDDVVKPPIAEDNNVDDDDDELIQADLVDDYADDGVDDEGDLPAKVIDQCVTVAFMLIRSPKLTRQLDGKWVKRSFWSTLSELQPVHYDFIASIVNALRPFYPRDIESGVKAPRHVLLSLNMTMLANYVLAQLGYRVSILLFTYFRN
jgi:hypothetical protein